MKTIFLSSFLTVISGVFVFVLCEILKDIWLNSLARFKEIKQKISYNLVFYANVYTNVIDLADNNTKEIEIHKEASEKFRELASELSGFIETLYVFKLGIPKKENLVETASLLMGLSNSMFCAYNTHTSRDENKHNNEYRKQIKELLKLSA